MNEPKYKPTLCVGADVHKDEIVLRAVDKALGHEVLERFRVTNNRPGAQAAAATLAQVAAEQGYTRIEIGWEATGMLWIPFHRYLSREPLLQPFELELICFNPKLVAKFKDGLVLRSPKNDDRDAFDIAARIRFGELPDTYVPGDFWQGLRRLTRYRYRLAYGDFHAFEIVEAFGRAAGRAKDYGFDAVQLHGAHGYLINEFLSPLTNRRSDGYGGSVENRCRFPLQVLAAMASVAGKRG